MYDRLARPLAPGRRWVANALPLSSDDRVLLLGCGTGLDLEWLPNDAAILAVDQSPTMVRRCRRRGAALGIDLKTWVGDARSVPRHDGSFDAVLVHLLLSVTDDPDAVLAEASRLLAAGGRLSVLDEPRPATGGANDEQHDHTLRAAGLAAERSETFGHYTATIASSRPGRSCGSPSTV